MATSTDRGAEFCEIYGEAKDAQLLDAFEAEIRGLGGKRLPSGEITEAHEFIASLAPRGKLSSVRLTGEGVFHQNPPFEVARSFAREHGVFAGCVGGAGELISVNMRWIECQGADTLMDVSNQTAHYDLPSSWEDSIRTVLKRKPPSEFDGDSDEDGEYTDLEVLALLDHKWGPRGAVKESRRFGPGIIEWPDRTLTPALKNAAAAKATTLLEGFLNVRWVDAREVHHPRTGEMVKVEPHYSVMIEDYFKAIVENPALPPEAPVDPALKDELGELAARVMTLHPLEVINLGDMIYISKVTLPGYQGRNPRTGQVFEVPGKVIPLARKIRKI